MINNNYTKPSIHLLLNVDFSTERGFSYIELLNFLKTFQSYYRDMYLKAEFLEKDYSNKEKMLNELTEKINDVQNLLKEKEEENMYLYTKIVRKLSFWERLTGKIVIKY